MPSATSRTQYPPFPSSTLPTAPLLSLSLHALETNSGEESTRFFTAAKELGFFYLSTSGSQLGEELIAEAEQLHELEKKFFLLDNGEKGEFAREKVDAFFGYRFGEIEGGKGGRNESYNMRKDDFLSNCSPLPQPRIIKDHWTLLQSYTRHCRQVIDLLITHLEVHLQLPVGTLASLHRVGERSGDHVRFNQAGVQPFSEEAARAGEHTDFGTLTLLVNWLGGLQIRHPVSDEWVYVEPIPGHVIVNLGDALVKFTAGLLRSNVHRVVPPPYPQDGLVRNSLVYFSRPEDAVVLRRLKGGLIDQQPRNPELEEEMTSQEWIQRRSLGDLKGVYTHSRGLESRMAMVPGRV
ncbi:hypothetical protein LTR62_000579 [Meristemomyces frigidus]|uniref:Fe2OG dioxygenase domain-containing protein n=1 Tax=Meristemomyces frigidus TaxID=1508187 RepID=A0AAN7YGS8_9PEZI|nr:hypothetical protein LTR62_000579 [Meristemomyces frigidus]